MGSRNQRGGETKPRKKKNNSNSPERLDDVSQSLLVALEALGRARDKKCKDFPVVERDGCQVRKVRPGDLVIVKLLLGALPLLRLLVGRGRQRVLEVVVGPREPFEGALDVAKLEIFVVLARAAKSDDVGLLD